MTPLKRFGITTGLAAAAAAKAAALYALGQLSSAVVVPTPIGLRIEAAVERLYRREDWWCAEVRKFSGDNPDVLDGAVIRSCVKPESGGVAITCGEGVGRVARPGLPVPPGECAINPVPRKMIEEAVREAGLGGAVVLVEVPGGAELASLTMNERVGVVGGVSILGTTGVEYPVSDEDYIQHVEAELAAVRQLSDVVALAQGNQSAKAASAVFRDSVVKIGDLVGDAVAAAARLNFAGIYVATMPGKLSKLAAGALNTHSKFCDCRVESVLYSTVAVGAPWDVVRRVAASASVGEAFEALGPLRREVARRMAQRAAEHIYQRLGVRVGIYVYDRGGELLAQHGGEAFPGGRP